VRPELNEERMEIHTKAYMRVRYFWGLKVLVGARFGCFWDIVEKWG